MAQKPSTRCGVLLYLEREITLASRAILRHTCVGQNPCVTSPSLTRLPHGGFPGTRERAPFSGGAAWQYCHLRLRERPGRLSGPSKPVTPRGVPPGSGSVLRFRKDLMLSRCRGGTAKGCHATMVFAPNGPVGLAIKTLALRKPITRFRMEEMGSFAATTTVARTGKGLLPMS